MHNFTDLKKRVTAVEGWLAQELSQVRTGRANPGLIDGVQVEAYGSNMPISQVASVTTEDPRTLRVSPWDTTLTKSIEKAFQQSDLGLGVAVDDKGLRLSFPMLTTERRAQFVKLAKEKLEQAKISLRGERDDEWQVIQDKEKEGGMGEDEKFRLKAEMEKIIQETQKKLEVLFEKKEKEVLEQ